jgi:hypothetical protein
MISEIKAHAIEIVIGVLLGITLMVGMLNNSLEADQTISDLIPMTVLSISNEDEVFTMHRVIHHDFFGRYDTFLFLSDNDETILDNEGLICPHGYGFSEYLQDEPRTNSYTLSAFMGLEEWECSYNNLEPGSYSMIISWDPINPNYKSVYETYEFTIEES